MLQVRVPIRHRRLPPPHPPLQLPTSNVPPGKKELRFKIPNNVKPGMTVTIADGQSGKRHSVRVPQNAKPGTELRIFVDK